MDFIWGNVDRTEKNHTLAFCIKGDFSDDSVLKLYAANVYRVFVDGKVVSYGPERTAEGHSRLRTIAIPNAKIIVVEVAGYNVWSYNNSLELPYFSAEIISKDKTIATSKDFSCHVINDRVNKVQRMSYQRNFIEYYDMSFDKGLFYNGDFEKYPKIGVVGVDSPVLIEGNEDFCSYRNTVLQLIDSGRATRTQEPIDSIKYIWWENFVETDEMDGYKISELEADPVGEISHVDCRINGELNYSLYQAKTAITGLIRLKVKANAESKIYTVYDELAEVDSNGKLSVVFTRPTFYNVNVWKVRAGEYDLLTFDPYEFKYLNVIVDGDVEILSAEVVEIANKNTDRVEFSCDNKKIEEVFEAGKNTFNQNVVDIYMDCPSRERAGWLCDSFFEGKAEQLLIGNSLIERHFLENFLYCSRRHLPQGMLPMCYPSENSNYSFIPNWAMWYVKQLGEYYHRTGDRELIEKAKSTVYGLIDYFKKFINSDGLLENLEGWIFIEWSIANDLDYVCGVNYPSNMFYSYMLETVAELYDDSEILAQAKHMKQKIYQQSFNGKFFVDNAIRNDNGDLVRTENISETCQYYALVFGIKTDKMFEKMIIDEFGPNRKEGVYSNVGKSNAFMGNYLRLMWLLSLGRYDKVSEECIDYFYYMAEKTGTLWEYQSTEASCNHGFTSVICVFIAELLFGYCGHSGLEKKLYFKKEREFNVNAKITLPIDKGTITIEIKNGERTIINNSNYEIKYI